MPSIHKCLAVFQVAFLTFLALFADSPQSPSDKMHRGSIPATTQLFDLAHRSLYTDSLQLGKLTTDTSSTADILSWNFYSAEMYSSFGVNVTALFSASRSRRLGLPCLGRTPCFDVPLRLQALLEPPRSPAAEICLSGGDANRVITILSKLHAPPDFMLFVSNQQLPVRVSLKAQPHVALRYVYFRFSCLLLAFALFPRLFSPYFI